MARAHQDSEIDGDCRRAVALAGRFMSRSKIDPPLYRLVKAELAIGQEVSAVQPVWMLTFKLAALIPHSAEQVMGAGGELFLQVNLETEEVVLRGYGE